MEDIEKQIHEKIEELLNSNTSIDLINSMKMTPLREEKQRMDPEVYYAEFEKNQLDVLNNFLSVGRFRKELYGEENLLNGNNSFKDLNTNLVKIDLGPNTNLSKMSEQAITNSALLIEHYKKIKYNYDENSFDTDKAIIDTVKLLFSNYALYAYSKTRRSDKYSV